MSVLPKKVSDVVTPALSIPINSSCESLSNLAASVATQVKQLISCVESLKASSTPGSDPSGQVNLTLHSNKLSQHPAVIGNRNTSYPSKTIDEKSYFIWLT